MKIKRLNFIFGICFWAASCALAKEIPLPPDHFVYEEVQTIDTPSKNELERLTTEHERLTGEQIYIAVFKSLEGENLNAFAEKIFRSWKIGQFKKNNGVLILVSSHERSAKISVGFGLEHLLSIDQAQEIVNTSLLSDVKVGNLGPGLLQTTQLILKSIGSPLSSNLAPPSHEIKSYNFGKWPYFILAIILIGLVYLADKIVAAEALFNKNGWRRIPILTSPFSKKTQTGGGACGNW